MATNVNVNKPAIEYQQFYSMKIRIRSMELLLVSNIVKILILLDEELKVHGQNFLHHEQFVQHDEYILLDHLVDRIEQSSQQLEYPNLLQLHQYIKVFPIRRYKIGRMSLFVLFAFVFPVITMQNNNNNLCGMSVILNKNLHESK